MLKKIRSKNKKTSKSKPSQKNMYDFSKHDSDHYNKYEEGFGAVVVAKSYDKVLLIGVDYPDGISWQFAKGHRNDGEKPIDAAIREVKEETSVALDAGDFILDDSNNPLTFKIEYPWQYGEDILTYYLSRVIEKQKTNPSERPFWNSTKPLKKCIKLYLAPVEMDRFKLVAQEGEVLKVEWVTWEEAHNRMIKCKSEYITALHDAFKTLKDLKKIPKTLNLPPLTKQQTELVRKNLDEQKRLIVKPIASWPKNIQPKDWQKTLDDMRGVTRIDDEDEDAEESVDETHVSGGNESRLLVFMVGFMFVLIIVGLLILIVYVSSLQKISDAGKISY
jgi:8-oxo-dGTP pyrophosphatase MutT (NUDIX family)